MRVLAKIEMRKRLQAKQRTGGLHQSLTLQSWIRVIKGGTRLRHFKSRGAASNKLLRKGGNSVNGLVADRARFLGTKRDMIVDIVLEKQHIHIHHYHHS